MLMVAASRLARRVLAIILGRLLAAGRAARRDQRSALCERLKVTRRRSRRGSISMPRDERAQQSSALERAADALAA